MSEYNIILRPITLDDAEQLSKKANNEKVVAFMRAFPYPYTVDDARDFINSCLNNEFGDMYFRVIEIDGEYAGGISLTPGSLNPTHVDCKKAELGYWLGEEYWGKGIMTSLVKQMCEYGFTHYDIERIEAEVYSPNIGSMRVLEKAGFECEAVLKKSVFKNGKLLDAHVFAKFRVTRQGVSGKIQM